jgi:hypothetical protein
VGANLVTRALSRRRLGESRLAGAWISGRCPGVYWDFNHFLCMYCTIYINYRGARLIAWLMFQTLLCRSALTAVFSSAVWVRDNRVLYFIVKSAQRWVPRRITGTSVRGKVIGFPWHLGDITRSCTVTPVRILRKFCPRGCDQWAPDANRLIPSWCGGEPWGPWAGSASKALGCRPLYNLPAEAQRSTSCLSTTILRFCTLKLWVQKAPF